MKFPSATEELTRTRTCGAPEPLWNKLNLFNPNAIEETNYSPGRHAARPIGKIIYPENDELLILHYKYIGFDYIRPRHALLANGLGNIDRKNNWALQFDYSSIKLAYKMARLKMRAVDISKLNEPGKDYPGARWWRPNLASPSCLLNTRQT
jgi:hypothetical protein